MAAIDNLARNPEIQDLLRRVRQLETATPMNSSSVGSGGMRVHSGGVINIENGGLVVNGSATIIGELDADGTINMTGLFVATGDVQLNGQTDVEGNFTVTGPTKLNGQTDIGGDTTVTGDLDVEGPLNVTGDTKLDGKTDIGGDTTVTGDLDVEGPLTVTGDTKLDGETDIGGDTTVDGTLDIKGKSTLQNDLEVKNKGKIKVGGMTLDPSSGDGEINFATGGKVSAGLGGVTMRSGISGIQVFDDYAGMVVGEQSISIKEGGSFYFKGLPRTSKKPNLYVDPDTSMVYQSTAG